MIGRTAVGIDHRCHRLIGPVGAKQERRDLGVVDGPKRDFLQMGMGGSPDGGRGRIEDDHAIASQSQPLDSGRAGVVLEECDDRSIFEPAGITPNPAWCQRGHRSGRHFYQDQVASSPASPGSEEETVIG